MSSAFQSIFTQPEICLLVGAATVAITWIVVWGLVTVRRHTLEANLKHAMIERGFPAEEIERILYAGSEKTPPKNAPRATASKSPQPAKELS